jgi:uncharacterized protein YdiU (UPF0061 family)
MNNNITPAGWRFENTYTKLPEILFTRKAPRLVEQPYLLIFNHDLAAQLGLDPEWLSGSDGVRMMVGNDILPGSDPVAQAYAGHQYGQFTMLGDGRAILLGEHITPDGRRFDIHLKGAGRTRYSRGGDGLAAVGPMVREYIISEAMAALGIPTTRCLAVIGTNEKIQRQTLLDGAVMVRVASSHIRVGTFQFAASCSDPSVIHALMRYTINRHFPEISDSPFPARAFLEKVVYCQAKLLAQWMSAGFIHGVMNTDNMAVSGETIDYGPCAFLDTYDPETVFSSIDHFGRYAFGNQPAIAQWNLARFAETLLPLIAPDEQVAVAIAEDVVNGFSALFQNEWLKRMIAKVGLHDVLDGDEQLVISFLDLLRIHNLDYTQSFRQLGDAFTSDIPQWPAALNNWRFKWLERVKAQPGGDNEAARLCAASNPAVIPRNHIVEEVLDAITLNGSLEPLDAFMEALSHPYELSVQSNRFGQAPVSPDPNYRTFCGT